MMYVSRSIRGKYGIPVIVLLLLWSWVYIGRPFKVPHFPSYSSYNSAASSLSDAFDFPPIESESIRSVCLDTVWNSSVIFTCDNSVGGVGNIRNSILNCVRYAILVGGSLVIPRIIVRSTDDISSIRTGQRAEFNYMFEPDHFVESLQRSCPPLKIYRNTVEVIPNYESFHGPLALLPESLVQNISPTGLANPEQWRGLFYNWLNSRVEADGKSVIIELGRSYLQYPIYSDGEGFALNFGNILKFRSDVRILGTKVLAKLSKTSPSIDLKEPITKNLFFGAHLRTEKDARDGWPAQDWIYSRYETQSKYYLEQVSKSNLSLIYVASGDPDEITKFSKDAAPLNLTITTKYDLLQEADKEELAKLAWDQQAMVDFLVMLKASDFAGVGHSSFAWNIALKRHVFAKVRKHLDGPQLLSDELSQIYGIPRQYPEYAACLWP